ncbi:UNVERIFIED_CONTAM: hypothetical protein Slati_2129700 [Sesamum latifolium]|uniref:Uncharacterized protein n=1 Tax=Sesamum latifolium TaxID=2727402 RepID=A0AAW2WQR8_9LAMI
MNPLAWNYQGLRGYLTVRHLESLIRDFDPSLIFLVKIKCKGNRIEMVNRRFGNFGMHVDVVGRSVGLAMLWERDIDVQLLCFSSHHVDVVVHGTKPSSSWRFTGFYRGYDPRHRKEAWRLLDTLSAHISISWLYQRSLTNC